MDLFDIAATFSAITGVLWVIEAFTLGIRRYLKATATANVDGGSERTVSLVVEPVWVDWLGKIFLYSLLPMLYFSIQKSLDFSILLSIATMATGAVVIAYFVSIRIVKKRLIELAHDRFAIDDPAHVKISKDQVVIETSKSFFPILLVVLVLRSFIAEPFQIPSGSMKPTLLVGDFIVVNKFAYGLKVPVSGKLLYPIADPATGDMIVFKPPHEPEKTYIKRVVGIPGDQIRYDYRSKRLWINGREILPEFVSDELVDGEAVRLYTELLGDVSHSIYKAYRNRRIYGEWIPEAGFVVPEGKYFVMGDNRDNSNDSRYWRFVDQEAILGKAFAIWLHWPSLGSIPSFSRNGMVE